MPLEFIFEGVGQGRVLSSVYIHTLLTLGIAGSVGAAVGGSRQKGSDDLDANHKQTISGQLRQRTFPWRQDRALGMVH